MNLGTVIDNGKIKSEANLKSETNQSTDSRITNLIY